jgi:two-component system response regulator BaeR
VKQAVAGRHGLSLDKDRFRATLHGRDLNLTAIEFQLLHILAESAGRIFSRSQLMDRIYPDRRVVSDRTIDSHVKKLRRKIAAAAPGEEWIHSLYGVGYKLETP